MDTQRCVESPFLKAPALCGSSTCGGDDDAEDDAGNGDDDGDDDAGNGDDDDGAGDDAGDNDDDGDDSDNDDNDDDDDLSAMVTRRLMSLWKSPSKSSSSLVAGVRIIEGL